MNSIWYNNSISMDNTVGSLTPFQESVVVGTLLGDGYLRIVPGRKNAFLEVNHSWKAREYVDWKYDILKSICISGPKTRKGKGKRIAYRFYTKQHQALSELYRKFYQSREKIIPSSFKIDAVILGVWFMDDGGRSGDSDYYLNTQKFSIKDQKRLIMCLNELGLRANLNKDKTYYRLRFYKDSISRLRDILCGIIIPSMRYKLGLNPVET